MDISLFDYNLPEKYIAKYPLNKRDQSNLLIYNRNKKNIDFSVFSNLSDFLDKDDILVANNVKVIPARIYGKKKTGGKVELLLVSKKNDYIWEIIYNSSKPLKIGDEIFFNGFKCKLIDTSVVEFNIKMDYETLENIDSHLPLPPYLKRVDLEIDRERYQTVYSSLQKRGAIAAPTAGLHFTGNVLDKLKAKGINIFFITLYVGLGTFLPVRCKNIEEHKMHTEQYEISDYVADELNSAKESGKNIVAVGTTTVRALEDNFSKFKSIRRGKFSTDIFIYPGYEFKITDKLITNFHLPKSTLLMLVSAFAGRENILQCYEEAKKRNFRFFSYGDSMFIV